MKIHTDINMAELIAKADADQDGERTTFGLFVQAVEAIAKHTGCPGYALIALAPTGMAVFASGTDVEGTKLCADMAQRVASAMTQRLEEGQGESWKPS